MKTKRKLYWLAPALLLAASIAEAGGVRMYQNGEVPLASDVAEILGGQQAPRPKMRGIQLDAAFAGARVAQDEMHGAVERSAAIGLPIEFGFNSAEIMPTYRAQLDAIAEGIKMTDGVPVVVEGHTDAHGPEGYNKTLSVQRAEAVKRYLVDQHGIDVAQLVVEGYGEAAPLDASDPYAPANRRVQFRAAN